jgi:hypothetical protein
MKCETAFYMDVQALAATFGLPFEVDGALIHFPDRLTLHLAPLADYPALPEDFLQLSNSYEQRGLPLVHLWEDVWLAKRAIVASRIAALLGLSARIHARETVVRPVDRPTLQAFLAANHLQGSPQAKYKYGLFLEGRLVAVASFSARRPVVRGGVMFHSYELVRFASLLHHTVTGGLSKLLAQFVADVQPDDIMSYADRDWSAGRSYERLGFSFVEHTPPQLFFVHPREGVRHYPQRLPAGLSEADMHARGYRRIYNTGNKKYLKLFKTL